MERMTLAARETTDVLLLDFAALLPIGGSNLALVTTLARALQIAGARRLELDTRELGVLDPVSTGEGGRGWGAVLYDNVPGGAGHVRELLDAGREWLEEALHIMHGSEQHHATCETACLDCLLTFDAQEAMQKGLLCRREAYDFLAALLATPSVAPKPVAPVSPLPVPDPPLPPSPDQQPDPAEVQERLRRIAEARKGASGGKS